MRISFNSRFFVLHYKNPAFFYSSIFYHVQFNLRFTYFIQGASDDFAIAYGGADFAYTLELSGGGPNGFDYPQDMIHDLVKETFIGYREFSLFIKERFKTVQ